MTIDEFQKSDLRVGTILEAYGVEGSQKLLRLVVDVGEKNEEGQSTFRQILSGIAASYAPADLVGRQACFVVNLESRQMMGLESQGMILAVTNTQGHPIILRPDQPVAAGEKIK